MAKIRIEGESVKEFKEALDKITVEEEVSEAEKEEEIEETEEVKEETGGARPGGTRRRRPAYQPKVSF